MWVVAGVVVLAVFAFVALMGEASAATAAVGSSCSDIALGNLGSLRFVTVGVAAGFSGLNDCTTGGGYSSVAAGASLTLTCRETTSGLTPPGVPDANGISIKAFADDTGFPNGAGHFFSKTYSSCVGDQTFSFFCTSDGTAGGSKRYGPVRLYIRAVRTALPGTYDDNSDVATQGTDSGQYGVVRCHPNISAVNATSGAGAVHVFVGGDSLTSGLTADSGSYIAKNTVTPDLVCGNPTVNVGSIFEPAASAVTRTTTIQGSEDTYRDDCTLAFKWTRSGFAALAGHTALTWFDFGGGGATIPSGTTSTASVLSWVPGQVVDRTLVPASCTVQVAGASVVVVNRGATLDLGGCGWTIAAVRGTLVPNAQPARVFAQRTGQYLDTGDIPSADVLWSASGNLASSHVVKTTATVTTGLLYGKLAQEFGSTARSSAVLWNWANVTSEYDVSSSWVFDGINISKTSLGVNVSAFIVGTDIEFARSKGLRDAGGALIVGQAVSCQRTLPDTTLEAVVSMGVTDASGNSAEKQFQVFAPAGTWRMTCSASGSGNSGSFMIGFFHVSAFTANAGTPLNWNVSANASRFDVNVSVLFRMFDPVSGTVMSAFPDEVPRITVQFWNASNSRFNLVAVNAALMTQNDGGAGASYFYRFTTDRVNLSSPGWAFVTANVTGSPFMGQESYILDSLIGAGSNGNFSGNFTGNVTILGADGLISTALDAYLPFLIWGGILLLMLSFNAWAPAMGAILAIADSFLPSPVMNLAARVMLFVILLFVHSLAVNGIIPLPWKRRSGG